jgi:hypothetical protein
MDDLVPINRAQLPGDADTLAGDRPERGQKQVTRNLVERISA